MKTKLSSRAGFYDPRALLGLTICLVGLSLAVFAFVTQAGLAVGAQSGPNFVVNTLADTDDGSCDVLGQGAGNKDCTLREAIRAGNAYGSAATITFSVSGTITLGSTLPAISNASGLTVDGAGQGISVSGNNSVQVMVVNGGATLTMLNLIIANGSGGHGDGGGFYNSGTLNVINSTLSGHSAYHGGGIENVGTLTVTNSTFFQNSAAFNGGGIENEANKTVTVTNCTFSSNGAVDGNGGGIYNSGRLNVANSTFSGNSAVASHSPGSPGGGIYNNGGSATLLNTIIANSPSGGNCAGGVTADQYNLADDNTCGSATQKTSAQINLQPLALNGGPTQTMAPGNGSAAIDEGDPNFTSPPSSDQRGAPRVVNGRLDVGAYEVQVTQAGPSFVVTNTGDWDSGMCEVGFCDLREAINAANAYSGTATITFNIPATDPDYNSSTSVYTITLGSTLPAVANMNGGITIDGDGQSITASGNNQFRVMLVNSGANLTLLNLTISNGSGGDGGGLDNVSTGTLIVANCTFVRNNTLFKGGAIYNESGKVMVTNSTFYGNSAVDGGGGIFSHSGTLTVINCTFSGNSTTGTGGGIVNIFGTANVTNTIIANTASGGNCFSSVTADSSDLSDDNTCGSATVATSARINLQPLADNGGPTETLALGPGSAAIDSAVPISLTTLSNPIGFNNTMFSVADATIIPAGVGFVIQIDNEQMTVIAKSGNQLTVTRGANNTAVAPHNAQAPLMLAFDQRGSGFSRTINGDVDIGAMEAAYTTLTGPVATPTYGSSFNVNASVANATSTGTVQFVVDNANYGSPIALTNGMASTNISGLGVGGHTITASYTNGGGSLEGNSSSLSQPVNRADTTTVVQCPSTQSYTGNGLTPCSATVTGPNGFSQSLSVNYSNNINVGTAGASATFGGNSNYNGSTGSTTFQITPATTMTSVQCPSVGQTFTNAAIMPCSATVTGPALSQSVPVSYSNNVNTGSASAAATYTGGGNYQGSSGSNTFQITPAPTNTVVTCPASITYAGGPVTPCSATATGPGLSQSLSPTYMNNVNVGTATANASFSAGGNYQGSSGNKMFSITQAQLSVTANNVSRAFGQPNPTFTVSYSGFKGTDKSSNTNITGNPTFMTTATQSSAPGSYSIAVDVSGLSSTNYSFVAGTPPGQLTIYLSGIIGLNGVTISSGDALVDSYNSAVGPYTTSKGSQAMLLANTSITMKGGQVSGNVEAAVGNLSLASGSLITGNALYYRTLTNQGKINGTITHLTSSTPFVAPVPSAMTNYTAGPTTSNKWIAGNYTYDAVHGNLTISSGSATIVAGAYNFNNVTLSGGSTLNTTGAVVIHVAGILNANGGSMANNSNQAGNLQFVSSYTGSQGVTISGGSQAYFSVYAPGTDVTLSGTSPLYGALIGKTLTISGASAVHLDLALGNVWSAYIH